MNDEVLPHLATFIRVTELGTFTAAAQSLGISQAAISQRVQQLEGRLGTALYDRSSGGIALTGAGKKLYEYARRIVALNAEARASVQHRRQHVTGELVLAASSIPGNHLLPPTLAAYRRAYPQVNVRARVTDSNDVLRLVEDGEATLGFVGRPAPTRHLEFQRLTSDELTVVVPAEHRFAARRRVSLRELTREPLIQREPGSGTRHCFESALRRAGHDLRALKTVLEVAGNEAIKEAVMQGLGVAVLSRRAVQHELNTGAVRSLRIAGINLKRELFIVCDRRRPRSAAADLFLARIQSAFPAAS